MWRTRGNDWTGCGAWARGGCELTRFLPLLARGESGSFVPKLWWHVRARFSTIFGVLASSRCYGHNGAIKMLFGVIFDETRDCVWLELTKVVFGGDWRGWSSLLAGWSLLMSVGTLSVVSRRKS